MIISGCNTTVINKQELKNEKMTTKEIKTIINKKIKYHEDYSKWLKERDSQTSYMINENIIEALKELKNDIENHENERR